MHRTCAFKRQKNIKILEVYFFFGKNYGMFYIKINNNAQYSHHN